MVEEHRENSAKIKILTEYVWLDQKDMIDEKNRVKNLVTLSLYQFLSGRKRHFGGFQGLIFKA
jgi:hypothetical protein